MCMFINSFIYINNAPGHSHDWAARPVAALVFIYIRIYLHVFISIYKVRTYRCVFNYKNDAPWHSHDRAARSVSAVVDRVGAKHRSLARLLFALELLRFGNSRLFDL